MPYTYQWRQCDVNGASCSDIGGATASTYATVSGDIGHTIRCTVNGVPSAPSGVITGTPTPPSLKPQFPLLLGG